MPVRILQLTDLHLSGDLDDRRWVCLQRWLAALAQGDQAFDRMVLTGDLARRGQASIYLALRALLLPWLDKLRVIPGNHDDSKLVQEIFGDRFRGGLGANFIDDLADLRLIGLDTSRPRRVSGKLGEGQLRWLQAVLVSDTPALVFMHHPPIKVGTWWLDKDILRDRNEFAALLQNSEVRGVFCGHVHQAFQGKLGRVPVWTAPSTAYQFKPGSLIPQKEPAIAAYRQIEFSGGALSTSLVQYPAG